MGRCIGNDEQLFLTGMRVNLLGRNKQIKAAPCQACHMRPSDPMIFLRASLRSYVFLISELVRM